MELCQRESATIGYGAADVHNRHCGSAQQTQVTGQFISVVLTVSITRNIVDWSTLSGIICGLRNWICPDATVSFCTYKLSKYKPSCRWLQSTYKHVTEKLIYRNGQDCLNRMKKTLCSAMILILGGGSSEMIPQTSKGRSLVKSLSHPFLSA